MVTNNLMTALIFTVFAMPVSVPDKIVLQDGGVIEACKVEKKEQELYVVFPHGRLKVNPVHIKEIFIDIDETYKPRNEFERQQLEKGLVFFEGLWRSKRKRDEILHERRRKNEARLKQLTRHQDWENAWRKETPHFAVITNTSEDHLNRYAQLIEDFYDIFTKRWGVSIVKGGKKRKPAIKIFRNQQQYHANGGPPRTAGVFDSRTVELMLYHDAADPRFTMDVLFHEATHLMIYLLRPDFIFPIWVNEGLAEYYGASVLDEKGHLECGALQEGRLAVLRYALSHDRYIQLERMVLTSQINFGTVHYAEAWCLVYFLIEHKLYRSRFFSFFSDLATGMGLDEVVVPTNSKDGRNISYIKPLDMLDLFKRKMGLPVLTELEREYLEFIYYGLPEVGPKGYVASARIKMRDHDFDGALDDLKIAVEHGAQEPNCFLHSARIHAMKGRYEAAAVDYMRAIERDPLNPEYHLEIGVALRASEDPLMLEEGLRHIFLATEIAPHEPRFATSLARALSGEDLTELRRIKERMKKGESERANKGGGRNEQRGKK
jgi:hypothetical protein